MRKIIITTTVFLLTVLNLSAQEKDNVEVDKSEIKKCEFSFSAGAGCAYMFDGISGLSSLSKSYNNKMRFGLDYNLSAECRLSRFSIGLMASVLNTKGSTEFTSDNIFINNYTMQFGAYWLLPELHEFSMKTTYGVGATTYTNNSKTYGNKRHISESAIAFTLNNEAAYRFSQNWAIALNVIMVLSGKCHFDVDYHDQTFIVKRNLPLSKISLFAGIKYTF